MRTSINWIPRLAEKTYQDRIVFLRIPSEWPCSCQSWPGTAIRTPVGATGCPSRYRGLAPCSHVPRAVAWRMFQITQHFPARPLSIFRGDCQWSAAPSIGDRCLPRQALSDPAGRDVHRVQAVCKDLCDGKQAIIHWRGFFGVTPKGQHSRPMP